jgi:hypothetical protein
MPVIAIAPPTRIATIGIRNGPKPMMESKILFTRRLQPSGAKALFYFGRLSGTTLSRALPDRALPQFREAIDRTSARILVELTGIEPVASWLQTRRYPS